MLQKMPGATASELQTLQALNDLSSGSFTISATGGWFPTQIIAMKAKRSETIANKNLQTLANRKLVEKRRRRVSKAIRGNGGSGWEWRINAKAN